MKLHGNARTCPNSRRLLVERVIEEGWSVATTERATYDVSLGVDGRRICGPTALTAAPFRAQLRSGRHAGGRTGRLQHELAVDGVDVDLVAFADLSLQQRQGEAVGQLLLDHPPQRPRAVVGVIAHVREQLARLVGERELHAPVGHALDHALDLQIDDLRQLRAGERVETHDVVKAIQQQNMQVSSGALGQEPIKSDSAFQITVNI